MHGWSAESEGDSDSSGERSFQPVPVPDATFTPQLPWNSERCLELPKSWGSLVKRGNTAWEEPSGSLLMGLGLIDGALEVNAEVPVLTSYLNEFVRDEVGQSGWTSVRVGGSLEEVCNSEPMEDHRFNVWVIALSEFQGGGMWVEGELNQGSVLRRSPEDEWKARDIRNIRDRLVEVPKGARRLVDPWIGGEVWAVKVFVHRGIWDASAGLKGRLQDMGFQPPGERPRVGHVEGPVACVPSASAGLSEVMSEEFRNREKGTILWEVDSPHEVWSGEVHEGFLQAHAASSYFGDRWVTK